MHLGGLDDRARRRDEPVEARGRVERGDRAGRRGPRPRSARARPGARAPLDVELGPERAQPPLVEAPSAPRGTASGRQNTMTPTLIRSPRSTRGTSRQIAYENGLRARARSASSTKRARRLEPRARGSRRTVCGRRPSSQPAGTAAGDRLEQLLGRRAAPSRRPPRRSSRRTAAARGRAIAANGRARASTDRAARGGSRARRRGRSATAARASTSRFGFCGVRSTFVTSASNQTTSAAELGLGGGPAAGRNGSAPAGSRRRGSGPRSRASRSWISGSGSARPIAGRARRARAPARAARARGPSSPATTSATSALGPWPAPRNFST